MSVIRRAALRWLRAMIRHSPAQSQEWGQAMLREGDFVEGEWPAVRWALGSMAALCRYSISLELRNLHRQCRELSLKRIAAGMLPLFSGAAAALVFLSICVAAFSALLHASWFDHAQQKLADRLFIVAIPETAYLACILALWRRRKIFAVGLLASAVLLMAHAIVHFASHV
jgi:hypothetical protein